MGLHETPYESMNTNMKATQTQAWALFPAQLDENFAKLRKGDDGLRNLLAGTLSLLLTNEDGDHDVRDTHAAGPLQQPKTSTESI
jgi:hypothetical protein